jgi:hypothetical protein
VYQLITSRYSNIINEDIRHANHDLLNKLNTGINNIREDVKTLVDRIESISNFEAMKSTILPDPNRDDYNNICFWDEDSLSTYTPPEGIKNVKLTMYLEYENGQRIPQALITKINDELRGYWDDMLSKEGEIPRNWTEVGLKRKDDFRRTFGGRYPWLRLCAFGWKIDKLWIERFSGWKQKHMDLYGTPANSTQGSPTPGPDPNITQGPTINCVTLGPSPRRPTPIPSPITCNDFDSTQATAGSKHGREEFEDIDDSISKRQKSDEAFTTATKFTNGLHHGGLRREAKKRTPKGPKKVSGPQVLFFYVLISSRINCIYFFIPTTIRH